ncbi:hypothetical protein [Bremerella cremea]|uniref:hypothetical protein n=2 Tax=Bremerella TaxID=2714594 RepID=UPI0031EE3CCD
MSQSKSEKMPLYRHGDVLVRRVAAIPEDAKKRLHLTLAEGEITGHSHRIAEPKAAKLYELRGQRFLEVTEDQATLVHEEHGPITLSRGCYLVWQQREYSPQEIRIVRD